MSTPLVQLSHCPRCSHNLAALPPRGRCPDCGFQYDEKMFLLDGWRLPGGRQWARALVLWGPIGLLVMAVLTVESGRGVDLVLVPVIVAVAAIAGVYLWAARRDSSGQRALLRYLITEDGVARPGRHIYLWRNYSHLSLIEQNEHTWRLHLYPSWWRLIGPPIVSARLECDQAEAEAVRHEIQRRINKARQADADEKGATLPRRWW